MPQKISFNTPVSPEFIDRLRMDDVAGYSVVHLHGNSAGVGTTLVPITSAGLYAMPTAAVSLEAVSSSANDTSAGTGARTIRVTGLDASWAVQTKDVTMNGVAAVAVSGTWLRVTGVSVLTAGTYGTSAAGSNIGTITVRVASAGATYATIPLAGTIGVGQSLMAAYTVPTGYTARLLSYSAQAGSTQAANIALLVREGASTVAAPYTPVKVLDLDRSVLGAFTNRGRWRGSFTGPCDIVFLGAATASTSDITVSAELMLVAS